MPILGWAGYLDGPATARCVEAQKRLTIFSEIQTSDAKIIDKAESAPFSSKLSQREVGQQIGRSVIHENDPHFFFLLGSLPLASATQLRIEKVTQPLYLHGADSEPRIAFQEVPYVTFASDPEWRFPAISAPFIPPGDKKVQREDVNLASLYKITVEGTYKDGAKDMLVKVDASKAVRPAGFPFTVEQVIDAVVTCVKIMYPAGPPEDGVLEIVVTPPGKNVKAPK